MTSLVATVDLPLRVKLAMYFRMFALQGSWNYETLNGTGVGFSIEPALRLLPGGVNGEAYRAALARESRYFNAHPYLAGVAVGALTRAELDGVDATRIERFRTALAGPLGSVGDRLVWASWLTSDQNAWGYSMVQKSRGNPRTSAGLKASITLVRARKAGACCWLLTYSEARKYWAAGVLGSSGARLRISCPAG